MGCTITLLLGGAIKKVTSDTAVSRSKLLKKVFNTLINNELVKNGIKRSLLTKEEVLVCIYSVEKTSIACHVFVVEKSFF